MENKEVVKMNIEELIIENAKLREEVRILRQYQRTATNTNTVEVQKILQDYIRVNQQLTDKIVELNG